MSEQLYAVLVIRKEPDDTLTGYFGEEGSHVDDWDADLGWPEPVNDHNIPSVLRRLADGLEQLGGD